MATPSEIAELSKCYCLNQEQSLGAMVYLLAQIEGTGMTLTEILDNSKCYCLNVDQSNKAIVYLLNRIVINGSTAGGGGILSGSGSPEGVQDANPDTLYVDTDPPRDLWYKETGTGNTGWVVLLENLP